MPRLGSVQPSASNFYNKEVALNEILFQLLRSFQGGSTSNSTVTSVGDEVVSTTLLSANDDRTGFILFNDSTAIAYVKFGATASTSSFTVRLTPYAVYTSDVPVYRGVIDCIWASDAGGNMRVTELE